MILRMKSKIETSIQEHLWKAGKKDESGIWNNIAPSCLSQWNTAYSTPLQQRTQSCLSPQHPEGGFLSRRCLSAFSSCSQVPAAEAKSWVNEGERRELLFLHNPCIGQRVYCGCGVLRILGFWSDHPCPISRRGDFMPVILGCGLLTLHQVISL